MGTKLSHNLIDLGFFSILGTSEHPAMCKEEKHVKRGTPHTYDSNNGVMVIYDEEGRPWLIRNGLVEKEAQSLIDLYHLQHGAYVPHSNDGGRFVHEVMSKL